MKNKFLLLEDCKDLFCLIIEITDKNKKFEYNLNNHVIRTAISIGSNIAEGNSYDSKNKKRHFDIALASCRELEFQLKLYEKYDNLDNVNDKLGKITATLINMIRNLKIKIEILNGDS